MDMTSLKVIQISTFGRKGKKLCRLDSLEIKKASNHCSFNNLLTPADGSFTETVRSDEINRAKIISQVFFSVSVARNIFHKFNLKCVSKRKQNISYQKLSGSRWSFGKIKKTA